MSTKKAKNNNELHVAIIPDRNRHWARERGLKPWLGHREGAKRIEEITRKALEMGIKQLTLWGSSKDNLTKRPLEEKRELLSIYEEYFKKLLQSSDIFDNEVKIKVLGRWREQFPGKLIKTLKEGIEKTKSHSRHFLNFLLAYNGDDDVLVAAERLVKKAAEKGEEFKVTAERFQEQLLTGSLPPVDLIIRTGVEGDPHNSAGFLMWQTQNSQYYFTPKKFPDFGPAEFEEAIADFQNRSRTFGK